MKLGLHIRLVRSRLHQIDRPTSTSLDSRDSATAAGPTPSLRLSLLDALTPWTYKSEEDFILHQRTALISALTCRASAFGAAGERRLNADLEYRCPARTASRGLRTL